MKVFWQQCEGQVIDGFPLRQYLGGDDDHGVFLTESGGETPRKAAIKLRHADPDSTEKELRRWRLAAELSHPNLMRLFERGTWQLNKIPLLYVVMEHAEEDLSQVIPQRPLNADEAKELLDPALSALAYLHSKGFVHGHVKPSNFMAIDERLKLATDGVSQNGAGPVTPADDVWSLGMTLVEALTQRRPVWNGADARDPVLPETLPAEFRDIAREALRRDPRRRWTVAQLQQRLRGEPVQAAEVVDNEVPTGSPKRAYAKVAGTVLLLILLVLVAGTLLLRNRAATTAGPSQTQPSPTQPAEVPQAPAPKTSAPKSEAKRSPVRPAQGEILQQVLPEALPRARNTIHGKVAVSVRVEVDPAGNVSSAAFESEGPSAYFAGLALKAAKRWKFAPADVASVWTLRFEFTRAGVKAAAVKAIP